MYKRRRRRTGKGKKKEAGTAAAGRSGGPMSVELEGPEAQVAPYPEPETSPLSSSKAVGARKRKPTQISKIVDKPSDEEEEEDEESEPEASPSPSPPPPPPHNSNNNNSPPAHNTNNNNSPPHKRPCLTESRKNGMIRSIVTELKSAKEASFKLDQILGLGPGPEGSDDEALGPEDLKVEGQKRKGGGFRKEPNNNNNSRGPKVDLANIKTLLNNNNYLVGMTNNGWKKPDLDLDEDYEEEEEEEGIDLRAVMDGKVLINEDDEETPYRCGACHHASADKRDLLRHMKSHKGERPFQCRLCFFAFTTKANCERHLRNRHGQIDRDQVRNLVVCLPTSSNGSESEPEAPPAAKGLDRPPKNLTCGGGLVVQRSPVPGLLDFSATGPAFGLPLPDDLPLDLSMDAVDLSTKGREGGTGRGPTSLLRPRPLYPTAEMPNLLVTSPFVSKREPMVHPQLPIPMVSPGEAYNGMFGSNGYSPFSSHPGGPPLPVPQPFSSLFPFGPHAPYNSLYNLPTPNMDKLMSLSRPKSPPSKLASAFMAPSPSASFGSRDSLSNSIEKDSSGIKGEKLDMKIVKQDPNSSSVSSGSPSGSSRKRSEPKDKSGEYQKPKQRRYRTERPFACPHCPARFTLRSNMERHGKHQHPTVWQRSPSNRVINRQQKSQGAQSPLVGPPTLVHPNKYTEALELKVPAKRVTSNGDHMVDGLSSVDVRAVIAQQLKRKLSNSNIRKSLAANGGVESGTETESDHGPPSTYSEPKEDLASVSQLLDRVKNSNIAQYFHEPGNRSTRSGSEEDDGTEEEGDTSEGDSEDEARPLSTSGREKKKSAYSSAPHKISCPHCSRRFPWTSSLRRHLLTHTGQKPYQCPSCPLLFTTKSNCDRHLARKHNGRRMKSGSGSGSGSEEDEDGDEDGDQEEGDGDGEEEPEEAPPTPEPANPTPARSKGAPVSNGSSPGEDAAFRCHLCEASAGEREALLTHMEEDHQDTFRMLVSKGALTSSPPSEYSETETPVPLDPSLKEGSHRKVMCVFCVRRFWSVEDLRRHIRSHSGERPFTCPHCSRRFTLKHSMLRHLKKHGQQEEAGATPKSRPKVKGQAAEPEAESDLIGRLLGLHDEGLVEQLLNKPDAKDAAKLLGLRMGLARHHTSVTASTN